jgi:hypothetical protein
MQNPAPVDDLLEELTGFATAVAQLPLSSTTNWAQRPTPDQWSLTEVMCHLRDVEREIHQVRFRALLSEDGAFIAGAVPDDWTEQRRYSQEDGMAAREQFLQARQETADLLANLTNEQWQRSGNHAFFGRTTLHELLNLVIQHDKAHWQQIVTLVAAHPHAH